MITLDNASNNNTMMEELAEELHELGIPFDKDGNRIRYNLFFCGYVKVNWRSY